MRSATKLNADLLVTLVALLALLSLYSGAPAPPETT